MTTLKIKAVSISEKKGTIKKPVPAISLNDKGIEKDAHAGKWHRQVSLLGMDSIRKFEQQANRKINYGEFAENITTEGFPLYEMQPLDQLVSEEVVLEVTQIGKKCHGDNCAIYKEVGNCVMPKEGIFARVLSGGVLQANMTLDYQPKVFNILIITLSDRAADGTYTDRSGPFISKQIAAFMDANKRKHNIRQIVIPDNAYLLKESLLKAQNQQTDLIITTGGTGIGSRDITSETVNKLLNKRLDALTMSVKLQHADRIPASLLSNATAGVMHKSIVLALPGSPKAIKEYLDIITKPLFHAFKMLHNLGH